MKSGLSTVAALVLASLCLSSREVLPQSQVTAVVSTKELGPPIPDEFTGLSFEMESVLPGRDGRHLFNAENEPLIEMFKALAIKSLRVGGNTADRPAVGVPSHQDIDNLFAFAHVAGVKVIYTLRLRGGDPERAAETAKYIVDHYGSDLTCFAIGNEPNVFAREYPAYRDEWRKYVQMITAPENAPTAQFCGPSSTPGKVDWCRDFARDFGSSQLVPFIAQHAYPGGSGRRVTSPAAGIDSMLSASWVRSYENFYRSLVAAIQPAGLSYRLEETNNFFNGGAAGVSNAFASALWGLDYMCWWASHGALGLNFHTGDRVAAGEATTPCKYAVFVTTLSGYSVHPLGYAIKAFGLGFRGRIAPVRVEANADEINLTAYGTMSSGGILSITLVNKEHGPGGRDAGVTLVPNESFAKGEVIYLAAPNGDVAATSGITLGGTEIKDDGTWEANRIQLPGPSEAGEFTVTVPAASAAIVRLASK
jgi:hypothetical protein